MKQILLSIFTTIVMFAFCSCDGNEDDNTVDTLKTINTNSEEGKEDETSFQPTNTDAGMSQLDMLVNSESGWINIDEYEGEQSIMIFTEDVKHNYSLDWNTNQYTVTSDGDWISLYDPEELRSGEFVMPECYAINFLSKDIFKICYVHMCARIKDEYWDTYVRIKAVGDIVALNRSDDGDDINSVLENINGKYIEVEYNNNVFRQKCTHFKIYKDEAKGNEEHDNFWFDHVMDGYEYHIENVSYDPVMPDKYVFEGTENYFEEIKSKLSFMLFNDYRVLTVESNSEKLWYMHEDDYKGIDGPAEPCDEEEY